MSTMVIRTICKLVEKAIEEWDDPDRFLDFLDDAGIDYDEEKWPVKILGQSPY